MTSLAALSPDSNAPSMSFDVKVFCRDKGGEAQEMGESGERGDGGERRA